MLSTDAVAIIGFIALFGMMLMRVPVGMAMGLVGVTGFAYLNGSGPALKIVGHTSMRTVTDYNFGVIPMFLLMGAFVSNSGMSRNCSARPTAFLAICAADLASRRSPPAAVLPQFRDHRSQPQRRFPPSPIPRCDASAIRSRSPPG
jgi:hypothetical protein